MKKILTAVLSIILLLSLCACGSNTGETAAVQKVSDIVAMGSIGYISRFAGVVVSGETSDVKKDDTKTILEVLVKEGDYVKKDDVLFSYDTKAMELDMEKLNLELEELKGKISDAETEIPQLEKKLKRANATDQLGYSLRIQSLKADILESTYKINLKERDIASLEEAMKHTDVLAPISGRIMSVKDIDTDENAVPSGDVSVSDAFITITDVSTFRVKGNINELNVGTLEIGTPVIVRSRLDNTVTWSGSVEKIDWDTTVSDQNSMYYYGPSDEMTSSSKYPFYIALNSFDDMLLGQHVYIEPDYGQTEIDTGLYLPEYFICYDGDDAFVWAENSRGKLEQRRVELGEVNVENGTVEILSGLTEDDSIAFPEDTLTAGMTCVPYSELMFSDEGSEGEAAGGFTVTDVEYSDSFSVTDVEY